MNLLNAVSSFFAYQEQIIKCSDRCVASSPNDRLVHLTACNPATHAIHPVCLAEEAKKDLRCPNCAHELNSLDIEENGLTDIEKRAVYSAMLEGSNSKSQTGTDPGADHLIRTLMIELQLAKTYIKTSPAAGLNKNFLLAQKISAAIPHLPTDVLFQLKQIQSHAHQNILLASFNSCKDAKDIESLVPFFEKGFEGHSVETIVNLGHCLARTKAKIQVGDTQYTAAQCAKIAKNGVTPSSSKGIFSIFKSSTSAKNSGVK